MNKNTVENQVLYKPIKLIITYFIILILIYLLGPLEWNTKNPPLLYFYLFFSHLFLYLGYMTTMNKIKKKNNWLIKSESSKIVSDANIVKYLNIFIVINLIMTALFMIRITGLTSFSIPDIVSNITKGIAEPSTQYSSKFENGNLYGGNILAPIHTILSPLLWPIIPLSLIYFKRINKINRVLVLLTIIIEAIRWISIGTNKGIIELILVFFAVVFLKQWQGNFKRNILKRVAGKLKVLIVIIFFVVIGLSVFQNNISSRIDNNYTIVTNITNYTEINENSPLMLIIPKDIQPLLVYTSLYLTQGYYGLSLALNEPFIPMLGVGNSYFLISNLEDLFDTKIFKYTYQARIASYGWDPFINWHSIYVWLANDLSFPGFVLFMFFFGKYLAVVIFKSIVHKDPITSVIFCLLLISIFYFSSNNQVLSSPALFMAFSGLNVLWFYKSYFRKKVYRQTKNSKSAALGSDFRNE